MVLLSLNFSLKQQLIKTIGDFSGVGIKLSIGKHSISKDKYLIL